MPKISCPGAEINYEIWGDSGPWVTLINGHLRPLSDFKIFSQKLIRSGLRVISLDNRGAGHTQITRAFTLADMVGDIVAIWDVIGCNQTHLMGISMGGFIAQLLALHHPQKIMGLILVSSAASSSVLNHRDTTWEQDPTTVQKKLEKYFDETFVRKNPLILSSMAKQMAKSAEGGRLQERANLQRKAIKDFSTKDLLGNITAKTLIIHGENDRIIPVSEARALARGIPSVDLLEIPETGHLVLAEKSKELYAFTMNFLNQFKN